MVPSLTLAHDAAPRWGARTLDHPAGTPPPVPMVPSADARSRRRPAVGPRTLDHPAGTPPPVPMVPSLSARSPDDGATAVRRCREPRRSDQAPARRDRRPGPGHRGGHVHHPAGRPDMVGANDGGAQPGGDRGPARVPSSRWSTGRSRVSPMKSLLDRAISTGQPVATSSPVRCTSSRLCQVFLPKSWVGSMSTPARGTPRATIRSRGGRGLLDDRGDHVGVADPVRVGPRHRTPGVRADDAGTEPGRDLGQGGVGARPGVVDQVGAGLACGDGDAGLARCRR